MNGRIAKLFGDLCEIQPVHPYHFLCRVDLHQGEILDDPKAAAVFEDLLKLGSADQVSAADLVDGDGCVDMDFQIFRDPVEDLSIAFALGGFEHPGIGKLLMKRCGIGISADQMDQKLLQIETDQLFGAEQLRFLSWHVLQVWVIQPAVEAASCLADDIGKDIAFCFVDLECLPSEKCHCFVFAAEGNDDQVRGNLSGCSDVVEFVGLMKGDLAVP